MRKLISAALLIGTFTSPVWATDFDTMAQPDPARFGWTGFYAGVSAGYSWQSDATLVPPCFNASCTAGGDGDVYGVFAGYNHQFGHFVVGAEASYTYHDNMFDDGSGVAVKDTLALKTRLGVAYDRFHVYGLVGAVYGTTTAPAIFPALADSDWGLIYGAGAEFAITDHIFSGIEYTHQAYTTFADLPIDADIDVISVRLGYKF